jgi:rod shape-determining protein MreD
VHLFGYINPYLYIMALLLLPAQTPRWLQYLIAFGTGFIIDIFLRSYGVQSFACVLMLFVRPLIENLISGRKRSESRDLSTFADKEFGKMVVYTLILVFIHHFSVMLLEAFTFLYFWRNLLVALGNTLFTTFLIICIEQLFLMQKRKK